MPLDSAEIELLRGRVGPVQVIDELGQGVTHATSGQLQGVDAGTVAPRGMEETKLVLFDENSRILRQIPGLDLISVASSAPGVIVTVSAAVAADTGPDVTTRG